MSFELGFLAEGLKAWEKLDSQTREHFKTKLAERLQNPRILAARLSERKDRYKIKLRNVGYRLVWSAIAGGGIAQRRESRDKTKTWSMIGASIIADHALKRREDCGEASGGAKA